MIGNNNNNNNLARIEGWLSIFLNLILFGIKFFVGMSIGSLAIIADAWHTLSDSFSSLVLLIGIKLSEKPPDKEHPYGHGRFQLLTTFVIGAILALVGLDFIGKSFKLFFSEVRVVYGPAAIVVTVISVVVKEALALFSLWGGRKTNSKALKAEGWHHRSDALSSLIILIGIFLNDKIPHVDAVLGFFVALCILYTAYEILKDVVSPLLGQAPSKKLIAKVSAIAEEESGREVYPHHFHVHEYGGHVELTFHIFLPADLTVREAHGFVDKIEHRIFDELDLYATVHFEPGEE